MSSYLDRVLSRHTRKSAKKILKDGEDPTDHYISITDEGFIKRSSFFEASVNLNINISNSIISPKTIANSCSYARFANSEGENMGLMKFNIKSNYITMLDSTSDVKSICKDRSEAKSRRK